MLNFWPTDALILSLCLFVCVCMCVCVCVCVCGCVCVFGYLMYVCVHAYIYVNILVCDSGDSLTQILFQTVLAAESTCEREDQLEEEFLIFYDKCGNS